MREQFFRKTVFLGEMSDFRLFCLCWYQTFDSLDILISAEVSLILRIFVKKIDMEVR